MNKKRCYIAGKIGDLPEEVYKAEFEQAKEEVYALGMIPISPVDLPHDHDRTWSSYMKQDIKALCSCDAVYTIRNWRKSPGATIEINTALSLGLDIIQQPMLKPNIVEREANEMSERQIAFNRAFDSTGPIPENKSEIEAPDFNGGICNKTCNCEQIDIARNGGNPVDVIYCQKSTTD